MASFRDEGQCSRDAGMLSFSANQIGEMQGLLSQSAFSYLRDVKLTSQSAIRKAKVAH